MFIGSDAMNTYAHFLQSLPKSILWAFRLTLLTATLVHVWMAHLLTKENAAARTEPYKKLRSLKTTISSRTMGLTGSILLFFIFFHLGDFTLKLIFLEYRSPEYLTLLHGENVHNVYKMVISSFSKPIVSLIYIIGMIALCMHLSHGVSSAFQSLGIRNKKWETTFKQFAKAYASIVFLGFSAIPLAVLTSFIS